MQSVHRCRERQQAICDAASALNPYWISQSTYFSKSSIVILAGLASAHPVSVSTLSIRVLKPIESSTTCKRILNRGAQTPNAKSQLKNFHIPLPFPNTRSSSSPQAYPGHPSPQSPHGRACSCERTKHGSYRQTPRSGQAGAGRAGRCARRSTRPAAAGGSCPGRPSSRGRRARTAARLRSAVTRTRSPASRSAAAQTRAGTSGLRRGKVAGARVA
jgi:hypothetical protein